MERLNKFLSSSGVCSRRNADELILSGKIRVNGLVVSALGIKIDPENDEISCSGKIIKPSNDLVYYALNKPYGIVCSAKREKPDDKIVTDLVPATPRVFPVGRLDKHSNGLIILTNDGNLTNELTHPSFEHKKKYRIESRIMNYESGKIDNIVADIKTKFTAGIRIEGKLMKTDAVAEPIIHDSLVIIPEVVLHTGYNRQIRKMCAKIGLEVTKLTRTKIGKLSLDDLKIKSGQYKMVTREEII